MGFFRRLELGQVKDNEKDGFRSPAVGLLWRRKEMDVKGSCVKGEGKNKSLGR